MSNDLAENLLEAGNNFRRFIKDQLSPVHAVIARHLLHKLELEWQAIYEDSDVCCAAAIEVGKRYKHSSRVLNDLLVNVLEASAIRDPIQRKAEILRHWRTHDRVLEEFNNVPFSTDEEIRSQLRADEEGTQSP